MAEGVRWYEYRSGRDPREDEAWFLELPAAERARLRARWEQDANRHQPWRRAERRRWQQTVGVTTLLLGLAVLLPGIAIGALGTTLPLLPVAGAVSGLLLFRFGQTRFDHAAIGGATYMVLMAPALLRVILGMGAVSGAMAALLFCSGLVLAVSGFAYLGLRRELRAVPGSE